MRRLFLAVAILAVLVICALGVVAPRVSDYLIRPPSNWPGGDFAVFEVKAGATAQSIAQELQKRHLIRSPWLFKHILRKNKWEGTLRPGVYRLERGSTAQQIAQQLAHHEVWAIKVTIPEGFTLAQIAERIEKAGKVQGGQWLPTMAQTKAAATGAYLKKVTGLGIPTPSAEGYLFPATYQFQASWSAQACVERMFREFYARFVRKYDAQIKKQRLSPHQIVTLASIVEREAGKDAERPIIAQVFLNRLAKGMKLESCATVQYALPRRKPRLLYKDLQVNSRYNTYLYPGLPPGPICSPGEASLRAVLNPQKTDALFFVAKGDGTHIFSRTAEEHEAAIKAIRGAGKG